MGQAGSTLWQLGDPAPLARHYRDGPALGLLAAVVAPGDRDRLLTWAAYAMWEEPEWAALSRGLGSVASRQGVLQRLLARQNLLDWEALAQRQGHAPPRTPLDWNGAPAWMKQRLLFEPAWWVAWAWQARPETLCLVLASGRAPSQVGSVQHGRLPGAVSREVRVTFGRI